MWTYKAQCMAQTFRVPWSTLVAQDYILSQKVRTFGVLVTRVKAVGWNISCSHSRPSCGRRIILLPNDLNMVAYASTCYDRKLYSCRVVVMWGILKPFHFRVNMVTQKDNMRPKKAKEKLCRLLCYTID